MNRVLLLRPDDHLLVGVEWSRMHVTKRSGTGPPSLVADAGGGELMLWFPPQHIVEEIDPSNHKADARLSGPSVLAFAAAAGDEVELTIEGLLQAAAELAVSAGSVVELPWRLRLKPQGAGGTDSLFTSHPVGTAKSGQTNPLWRTRLHTSGSEAGEGRLRPRAAGRPTAKDAIELVGVDGQAAAVDDPFEAPLDRGDRKDVVHWTATSVPALAERLELSALGGTLVARGRWSQFEWDHRAVLGRDMSVRTLAKGLLYPTGHRAELEKTVVREVDPAGNVAVLRSTYELTIVEPVRAVPNDDRTRRLFPFDEVEITETRFTDVVDIGWQDFEVPPGSGTRLETYVRPVRSNGEPVLFPMVCHAPDGPVELAIPLLFVKDYSPDFDSASSDELAVKLREHYGSVTVQVSPTRLDLVRAPSPADEDRHLVRGFTIGGSQSVNLWPSLEQLEMSLPALGRLLDNDDYYRFSFTDDFLEKGASAQALLRLADGVESIPIDFAGKADRSGALASLNYEINAISRKYGPVKAAVEGATELVTTPAKLFEPDATLLGYPLRNVIEKVAAPPAITSVLAPAHGPVVSMKWSDVVFKKESSSPGESPRGGFVADDSTSLTLDVTSSESGAITKCTVSNFAVRLPTAEPLVELSFRKLTYVRRAGVAPLAPDAPPDGLTVEGLGAKLLGKLKLLEELGDGVSIGDSGPKIVESTTGVGVSYAVPLPAVASGVFVMQNILLRAGVDVPFTGKSPEVVLGFASREAPFVLTVMAFGGGGYLALAANDQGLSRLDASLEFGAVVAVDFFVARGEAHVLGGVRFVWDVEQGEMEVTGYIRIGGTLDVLELVSASVELRLELTYQSESNTLVGRATLILEIDVLFLSESVELDSGEWRLVGGQAPERRPSAVFAAAFLKDRADPLGGKKYVAVAARDRFSQGLANWSIYRSCFADPAESVKEVEGDG